METRTTVYATDTAEARRVAVRAMGAASGQRPIAAWRNELSDCSVTITSLATALDTARNELARYQGMTMHADHPAVIAAERDRLRASLENMVSQFAFWAESTGGYWTGGLSALEEAFEVLDWNDPSENPEARCDEPGCMKRWTCGTPTPGGYRTTCFEHQPKVADEPPTA